MRLCGSCNCRTALLSMHLFEYELLCIKSCCWAVCKLALWCYLPPGRCRVSFLHVVASVANVRKRVLSESDPTPISQIQSYPTKSKRSLTYSYLLFSPNSSEIRRRQISLIWDLHSHYFSILITLFFRFSTIISFLLQVSDRKHYFPLESAIFPVPIDTTTNNNNNNSRIIFVA